MFGDDPVAGFSGSPAGVGVLTTAIKKHAIPTNSRRQNNQGIPLFLHQKKVRGRAKVQLESAKQRLIYSLLRLNLPLASKAEDPASGLAFQFLADGSAQEYRRQRPKPGLSFPLLAMTQTTSRSGPGILGTRRLGPQLFGPWFYSSCCLVRIQHTMWQEALRGIGGETT